MARRPGHCAADPRAEIRPALQPARVRPRRASSAAPQWASRYRRASGVAMTASPYFQHHSVGWLFLLVVICFFGMEVVQFFRQRHWRRDATRVGPRSFWVAVVVWVIVATVILHRAGNIAPGAAMEHGARVFAVGMVL